MTVEHSETIAALRSHLERYPADSHPVEHATVQFNLGLALAEAPGGDRTRDLTEAIEAYAGALEVFGELAFPSERARVLTALGAAERDLGTTLQARDRFDEAVRLLDRRRFPAEFGAASNDLGLAQLDLGDIDAAVAAFEASLEAFHAAGYARQRAATLHNLGLAHARKGAPGDLARSISAYRAALELVDPTDASYVYAATQHSLGTGLLDVAEDRRSALAEAVLALQAALSVFTRAAYPFQHAVTKNNLGIAYEEMAPSDPTSLRRALSTVEEALALLDPRLHPEQWAEAKANLDRIEQALDALGLRDDRSGHLAKLLAVVPPSERRSMLRYRLTGYLQLRDEHRNLRLAALDQAVTALDPEAMSAVTVTWLQILMEVPDDGLVAALRIRHEVNEQLAEDERRHAAKMAMEDALGELEILQRIRVRDLLVSMGYERPEPP